MDVVPVAEQASVLEHEGVWQVVETEDFPVAVTVLQVTTQSVIVWEVAQEDVEVFESVAVVEPVD